METSPQLGKLITDGERRRDAIHVAVAPVTAAERLAPGQPVGFVHDDDLEHVGKSLLTIGVVDPFLTAAVEPGQRFWLFLYPGTVTGLRHVWTHPTFARAASAAKPAPTISDRDELVRALDENEDDTPTRLVYADWLDDHGEHQEADRQRQWPAAKAWLREFCGHEPDEAGGYSLGVNAVIGNARGALEDGSLVMECGANEDMCNRLRQDCREFWQKIAIVTGLPLPEGYAQNSRFGCGC